MEPAIAVKRRFRKFVEVDPVDQIKKCWIWIGCLCKGYGVFSLAGKKIYVHRWIWELVHGAIPDSMQIHHVCGVKSCCNPRHLELIDHSSHMKKHAATGVWSGSRNGNATRTTTEVLTIKFLRCYLPFLPVALIAKHTGTPLRTVYWIINGGGWSHVELPPYEVLKAEFENQEREAAA